MRITITNLSNNKRVQHEFSMPNKYLDKDSSLSDTRKLGEELLILIKRLKDEK